MAQSESQPASQCIKCSEGRHENCLRYKGYFCKCPNEYHEKNRAGWSVCMSNVVSLVYTMATGINDKIAQFLRECQTWEKKATNILGVFLLKLPASKQNPSSIAIEINQQILLGQLS